MTKTLPVLAAAALAACAGAATPVRDPARPPVVPRAPVIPATWSWAARATGPWRLPGPGFDIEIADAGHAIVALTGGELVVVDLATGEVGPATPLFATSQSIDDLVRIGDRVVAFGRDRDVPAAWELTAAPLAAAPVALPDPGGGGPDLWGPPVTATSPDGAVIVVCGRDRWPTARDARTLDVLAVATGTDCDDAWFTDAHHVVIAHGRTGGQVLDVATGALAPVDPAAPEIHAGPAGRTVVVDADRLTLTDARGRALRTEDRGFYFGLAVLPDGRFVTSGVGGFAIHPAGGGERRDVELPTIAPRFAVDAHHLVTVADYAVIAVDLDVIAVHAPAGSVGPITQVAPRAGAVIAAADRLRAWRDGALVATGPARVARFAADPPDQPVEAMTGEAVVSWDPAADRTAVVRRLDLLGWAIARDRRALVYDDGYAVYRRTPAGALAPWFHYPSGLVLAALDATTDRVAWSRDEAYHVVDVSRATAWSFQVAGYSGCGAGLDLKLERGSSRLAVQTTGTILRFDAARRRALDGVELVDGVVGAWDLVPGTGEVIMASDAEVVVWAPGTDRALAWRSPIATAPPAQIGVDAAGLEAAIAYQDGSVVWVNLAGLRAHARPRAIVVHPAGEGACPAVASPPSFDDLVGAEDGEAPPAPDATCDDTNDRSEDDCAAIYGLPPADGS